MFDMELECMCKNNSPTCEKCWDVPMKGQQELPFSTSPFDPKVMAAVKAMTTFVEPPARTQFQVDVALRFQECEAVLLAKHEDYGPANIANAPGGPMNGLRVRVHDKLARINHLADSGASPANESVRDSWVDMCNYSLIALMVIDNAWPGTEHK